MLYHRILLALTILFVATAGYSNFLDRILPSRHKQEQPPAPPPPPSPKSAEDQVKLPPEARPLKDSVLVPIDTRITIALLLPLSGGSAALGKDLQDAAELALFDIKNPNIRMLPLDTKGTPEGAVYAVDKAVAEHASIILGPLFSQEASAIATTAKSHNIPVVSFSNNTDLTKEDIFVFGFMPQQQTKRVLEYALKRGIQDYYVIAPDDTFGEATLEAMEKLKERGEITVHVKGSYNAVTNQGMVDAARNVTKDIMDAKKYDDSPKPRALLIPEGGNKLLEISKLIAGFGLNANDVRLIGSGQWDDEKLGHYKRLYGGWFATASPTQRDIFEKHFEKTYHYRPVRIASIAYDAVALVGFLSQQYGNHISTAALINERGFAGVDGAFRFDPNRIAERSLAILEVIPNGFEIVDEAPKVLKTNSDNQ